MNKTTDRIVAYEEFLKSLRLEPELFQIKTVEMDLKGELNPTEELNNLFFVENKWFGFQDFFDYYLRKNETELRKLCGKSDWEDFKKGLRARLYRTQFGFLTEYHAFFMAKIVFGEDAVKRDIELDREGVDFQICYKNEVYNIHIFVDTPRAWRFRNYKSRYKKVDTKQGTHVNFPYSLSEGRVNSLRFLENNFGVYTKEYVEYLKVEIDVGNIKNKRISGVNAKGFIYN